jgi:hypothetical protein
MSFVKLKHEIDEEEEEEEPSVELKVLSKDLAYPLLSWFIYPKSEKHFSYKPSTQEIYPYSRGFTDAVHFHIDYVRYTESEEKPGYDKTDFENTQIPSKVLKAFSEMDKPLSAERLSELEEKIGDIIRTSPDCYANTLKLETTAEYGPNPPEIEFLRIPFFHCRNFTARDERQAFAISAGFAKKLNTSELSKDYFFFPHTHRHRGVFEKKTDVDLFVVPRKAVEKAREFFNNLTNKLIGAGAKMLTPEVKPPEGEVSEEEVAKAWGLKLD